MHSLGAAKRAVGLSKIKTSKVLTPMASRKGFPRYETSRRTRDGVLSLGGHEGRVSYLGKPFWKPSE